MGLRAVLFAACLSVCVCVLPPVTNVTVRASVRNRWVTGAVDVSWSPPVTYAVSRYSVTVSPLDLTLEFSSAEEIEWYGLVRDVGRAGHTVGVDETPGQLLLTLAGGARGEGLLVYTKLPDASVRVEARVNAQSFFAEHARAPVTGAAPGAALGLLLFDAGRNRPLLRCELAVTTDVGGGNPRLSVDLRDGNDVLWGQSTAQAGSGLPWPSQFVHIRMWRAATGNWTCETKVGGGVVGAGTADWQTVATTTTLPSVAPAHLPTHAAGDVWVGVAAHTSGGTSGPVLTARVDSLRFEYLLPSTPPSTLYGAVDVCAAGALPAAQTVDVFPPATTASFAGLFSNVPYHVSIVAEQALTSTLSLPSLSVRSRYFWPRPMPPNSHALSLWLDARTLPAGALARWPDASGNGHHMVQPTVSLRPTVRGGDLVNPAFVNFAKARGNHMRGGADSLDLGITGDFTLYLLYRGTSSTPQVIAGRGPLADDVTSGLEGWAAMVYNELFAPFPGFIGLRVVDAVGDQAGIKTGHYINTDQAWVMSPVAMVVQAISGDGTASSYTAGSPGYVGAGSSLNMTACRGSSCASSTGIGVATAQTFRGPVAVTYAGAVSTPVSTVDMSFRLGGPARVTGDPLRSYDGDIAQLLIYREAHDSRKRAETISWLNSWMWSTLCPSSILTVNSSWSGQCADGNLNTNCYQVCSGLFTQFLGVAGNHWCSSGTWSDAPLICRRGCPDLPSPRYSEQCSRVWLQLRWGPDAEANQMLYFITSPGLRITTARNVWIHDVANARLLVDTTISDPCERVTAAASSFVIHPSRWNLYVPTGVPVSVVAELMLLTPGAEAGVVVRCIDGNNMYRVLVGLAGARIVRLSGGRSAVVGTTPNVSLVVGELFALEAVATGPWIGLRINGATRLNVSDPVGPAWGSTGHTAEVQSQAAYYSFRVTSGCDLGIARYMVAGTSVSYACKQGYDPIGTPILGCGWNGQYNGTLSCRSRPPIAPEGQNFSVPERSPNNTLLGTIQAVPANLDQTLTYSLVSQWPLVNSTLAFSVTACSGAIRVADPAQMDFNRINEFVLTVRIAPDGEVISSILLNVTVLISNVLDYPELQPAQLDLEEHYVGPVQASIPLFNPDRLPVEWRIAAGNDEGLFTIDTSRGNMSVGAPGASFAAQREYALVVMVTALNGTYSTSSLVQVNILDVNSPPTVSSDSFLLLDQDAVDGATLGVITADDPDTAQPAWRTLTYTIVENTFYNPSNNSAFVGVPLLRLNAGTAALIFNRNASVPPNPDVVLCMGSRECIAELMFMVSVCDAGAPPLCTNATMRLVLLASYNTLSTSRIVSLSAPASLSTSGGDDVVFVGRNLPVGSPVTASYGRLNSTTRFPGSCRVLSTESMVCTTSPGWGSELLWDISVRGARIPSLALLMTSYAVPTVTSISYPSRPLLSTAGTPAATVRIIGTNLGPSNAPVTVRAGGAGEVVILVTAVSHTLILGTLGAGCGASLPVTLQVGDQLAAVPDSVTITFPSPTLSSMTFIPGPARTSTASEMDGRGGDTVLLNGTDFGPLLLASRPVVADVTYETTTARGVVKLSAVCVKVDAVSAHTELQCTTSPGAGLGFRWSVQVCGQQSGFSAFTTSYARPVLSSVSGSGASGATTEGGQLVVLQGKGFGPLTVPSLPWSYPSVRYGTRGSLQYSAVSCEVTSIDPSIIQCLTAEGTGRDHVWSVEVGGVTSAVYAANTSYAPPSISFFSGAATAADTRGVGQFVRIAGLNFGSQAAVLDVTYTDQIGVARERDGVIPGSPPGLVTYRPPFCNISQPHREITCLLAEGAGTGLNWNLIVDGQRSTTPTTAYAAPVIASVTPVLPRATVTTDGGDEVWILGRNFGPEPLIQSVRYGPSGGEYSVSNFTFIDHTRVRARLQPGVGGPLRFTITTADQTGDLLTSLRYADPAPSAIVPSSGDTETDTARPTVVTVSGVEFGLLARDVEVGIAFGNAGDSTLRPLLPIIARKPTTDEVASPTWQRPASPVQQSVSFILPEGIGASRAVRVVPYLRNRAPSPADVAAKPLQFLPSSSVLDFTYFSPSIAYVEVDTVTTPEDILAAQASMPAVTDVSSLRKLSIRGRSFGPDASLLRDSVQRVVEMSAVETPGLWSTADVGVASWSHRLITAFTNRPSAILRVRINSVGARGQAIEQSSIPFTYSNLSPKVLSVVGQQDNFQTAGGEIVTITVRGLDSASTRVLNVTVGGRRCTLQYQGADVAETNPSAMLLAQFAPPVPPDAVFTLRCRLPEGQGSDVPVLVIRDGAFSATNVTISYARPVIARASVWSTQLSQWLPLPDAQAPLIVPTTGGRILLEGENLGVCPAVVFNTSSTLPATVQAACIEIQDVEGRVQQVVRTDTILQRSHRSVEVMVPDGEGTGLEAFPGLGWSVQLVHGSSYSTPLMTLRYAAPIVTAVSPPLSESRGGLQITVQGENFGVGTPSVQIGSDTRPWLTCSNVQRLSHFNLTCTLPEGSGANLQVAVTVADQRRAGAAFAYATPSVHSFTLVQFSPLQVFQQRNPDALNVSITWTTLQALWRAAPRNATISAAQAAAGSRLRVTAHGFTSAIIINGTNLGAREDRVNCAFFAFPDSALASKLKCNGVEDVLGEGELPPQFVLHWGHEAVAVLVPPGAGPRILYVVAGGQGWPVSWTANIEHETPQLNASIGFTPFRTDGGDTVTLSGRSFPPLPALGRGNVSRSIGLSVPFALQDVPLLSFLGRAHVRVNFMSKCLAGPTVADEAAIQPAALASCFPNSISSIELGLASAVLSDAIPSTLVDRVSLRIPAGVGSNKPLSISIVAGATTLYTSDPILVRYAAPVVTQVFPRPILDAGEGGHLVMIAGENFGRVQDLAFFAPEELALNGSVGHLPCASVERVVRGDTTLLQCRMGSRVLAGASNITVVVAGQEGTGPSRDAWKSVFVGCRSGFYAHAGEECLPCPRGAKCDGFVVDPTVGSSPRQPNVTAGPVKRGNIMFDEGGVHTYPVPLVGFFDLNGTMAAACPDRAVTPGRDVCIVACIPADACAGLNLCSEPYQSLPPFYRCSSCARGFFRAGGDCIRCPDQPALVFVGFILAFCALMGVGYFLHKYNFNIAVISLGVDFFQVVSVFAAAKVGWPPILLSFFRILSSFNFSLDIMAPECLIPDVSFITKFVGIVTIPFATYGLVAAVFGLMCAWKFYVLRRRTRRDMMAHLPTVVSAGLIVLFLAYLNVTRTIFSLFVCLPPTPPDGRTYLSSGTVEPCGEPGGAQQRLTPYAVVVLIGYTLAYPAAVLFMFVRYRELIMEDQLLRALETGDNALTNLHALWLRRSIARTYYQFKPDYFFWMLSVLLRKFGIAFAALVFSANAGFQLSATLMVLFLAYAAQVRWRPYMPPMEYPQVIHAHNQLAEEGSAVHQRLKAAVAAVGAQGKKRARANKIERSQRAGLTVSATASFLMNYNTVEAFLLFAGCIVCLCALMLKTLTVDDAYFEASRTAVSVLVLLTLIIAILYYVSVVIADISLQARGNLCIDMICGTSRPKPGVSKLRRRNSEGTMLSNVPTSDAVSENVVANPIFAAQVMSASSRKLNTSTVLKVDVSQLPETSPPDPATWSSVRSQYMALQVALQSSAEQLRDARAELARRSLAVDSPLGDAGASSTNASKSVMAIERLRKTYQPVRAKSEPAPAAGNDETWSDNE